MLSITYLSDATTPFDDDQLAVLLLGSRANNTRDGLSGVLLHRQGRFMQVLEGPEAVVRRRYAVIERDPRHARIEVLSTEIIDAPRFGQWSMGYQPLTDDLAHELPGFTDFFSDARSLPTAERSSNVAALLMWFRNHPVAAAQH
ncbi:BLUF domain-containing protein [Curtobacterium sp. RRHDQ10]|uniref:BLUF domain-containing protein n=1 Tax=Curtobacterium phyllosphaerae TaxID=3413379 RepID=UPI003BF458D6